MTNSAQSSKPGEPGAVEETRGDRRFRLLAEAIPQIVWTTRADGYCDYQNRRWNDYSGMTPEESAGLGWMAAVHPDDRDRCGPVWGKAPGDTPRIEFEYRLRRWDGEYRWFLARAEPILDDEGKVVRWFGTSTDIDDSKRLAEDQRLDRKLADASPAVLYIFDIQARKNLHVRGRPLSTLGYTGAEVESFGDDIQARLMHPEDKPRLVDHLEVMKWTPDDLEVGFEYRMRHADGSYRWFLSYDTVYERDLDGMPLRILGTALDVTDRKHWLDRLRASEARLKLGLQVGGLALVEVDHAGQVMHLSPEALEAFGLPEGRTVLPLAEVHAMFHPEDRAEIDLGVARSLDPEGDGWFAMEHRIVRPDGEVRWHSVRKQVHFEVDAQGRRGPVRSLLAIRDVTDARRAEEALRSSEAYLRNILDGVLAFIGLLTPTGPSSMPTGRRSRPAG